MNETDNEKLNNALGLIKTFCAYQLQDFVIDGERYVELSGFEALKAGILVSAIDANLFTERDFNTAKDLADKLLPLIDKAGANDNKKEEEQPKSTTSSKALGKLKAKMDVIKKKK